MINWEMCRQEFAPDGALRDIYVLETNIEHWRKLFRILTSAYKVEYSVNGNIQQLPSSVDEILKSRGVAQPLMRFQLAGATIACHFFCFERIELDIDPREVNSETTFNGLIGLLKLIGDGLNKPAIMTQENNEKDPFLSYEPSKRDFLYSPCQTTL
jgi:hypothetical protein